MSNEIVQLRFKNEINTDSVERVSAVDKSNLLAAKKYHTTHPLSKKTLQIYAQVVDKFNEFLDKHDYPVNKATVRKFLVMIRDNYCPATAKLYKQGLQKAILQQFGKFDIKRRMAIKEVFESVQLPTPDKSVSKIDCLNEIEVRDLIRQATNKTKLIICFLFKTGVRVSELINVKLVDCVPIKDNRVKVRIIAKGNKERHVVISSALYDKICTIYNGSEYLFETSSGNKLHRVNVSKQIKRVGRKLNFCISAHSLRHSRATDLNRKGFSLYEIKNFLGHSRVDTTENMYLHDEIDAAKIDQKDNFTVADFDV